LDFRTDDCLTEEDSCSWLCTTVTSVKKRAPIQSIQFHRARDLKKLDLRFSRPLLKVDHRNVQLSEVRDI
jgi:hypothetical protein